MLAMRPSVILVGSSAPVFIEAEGMARCSARLAVGCVKKWKANRIRRT